MGIYLVGIDSRDWLDGEVLGAVAVALDAELERRGWEGFTAPEPGGPGAGVSFEEKMNRPIDSFADLCRKQAGGPDALLDWDLLIPVEFDGALVLPVPSDHDDTTTVRSAHRALDAARRLADGMALPPGIPRTSGNLDIVNWFDGPAVGEAVGTYPGPWSGDLDAAFYTAVYLRAAEHSLRRECPIAYS
ncbi:hypothetical protein [Wenjunlia tyrosinilytica]|uniref:hypothetical protein n=1 Tax=Wenjunlia tyrosinilytica TaxID=1544741 RepID=UPI001E4B8B10|nr:hypothetical protein [Wenjunlia tyrosinilytica]